MLLYGLSTLPSIWFWGLRKIDWGWALTTYSACAQGQNIKSIFRKKTEKGTDKGKAIIYCFYDIILLFKSMQVGRAQIFFNLTLFRMGGKKGPLQVDLL